MGKSPTTRVSHVTALICVVEPLLKEKKTREIKRKFSYTHYTDHVPNTTIYAMTMTTPLFNSVKSRQLRFLGHILRLPDEELARRYAVYTPPHGRRKAGRPRTLYLTYIQQLLGDHEGMLQEQQIATLAKDCRAWRKLVVACAAAER